MGIFAIFQKRTQATRGAAFPPTTVILEETGIIHGWTRGERYFSRTFTNQGKITERLRNYKVRFSLTVAL